MKTKKQTSIRKILDVIQEFKNQGKAVTTQSIADTLGISKQRVHFALKEVGELSRLDRIATQSEKDLISQALKQFDTANLSIHEIGRLPIQGIAKLSFPNLVYLIRKHDIPHSQTIEDRLSRIDTAQYTIKELQEAIGDGYHPRSVGQFIYKHKLPYKGKNGKSSIQK
ncbi:hypothetical protein [Burkholderia sp. LMG 13014]|uniref:hypothetical protein n=1 Tax=Burkholderia sp. LMG 13014 TaxID=2709306 RepID=UPI0019661F6A|nr:hypothetical protein [Burkholderia sp. LMG 13014]